MSELLPVLNSDGGGLIVSLLSSSELLDEVSEEGWSGSTGLLLVIREVLVWDSSEVE
jgi:hypothetical protein